MIENKFTYIAEDNMTGEYHFIQGIHDLGCSDVCPDDIVFISQSDSGDYLYRKSIESVTTIPMTEQTNYQASNSILLSEDFKVELGEVFTAQIFSCPW